MKRPACASKLDVLELDFMVPFLVLWFIIRPILKSYKRQPPMTKL